MAVADTADLQAALQAQWQAGGPAACQGWLAEQLRHAGADQELALQLGAARGYRSLAQHELAQAAYEQAIGLAAEPGLIHLERARLYLEQHDLGNALDSLQLAVTWCSNDGLTWLELGEVLLRLDRKEDARDALVLARSQLVRTDTTAMTTAAPASLAPAATNKTLSAADALLRCDITLGSAYMRSGDPAAAASVLRDTVLHRPQSAQAWMALGHAELVLDNDAASARAYERAIELSAAPSPALLLHHGVACQQLGQWDLARERFARILEEHPGHANARWYLCQAELALGHWSQGWALFGARFTSGALQHRAMPFRPWDGRPAPADTLLILADEGLGDEILYGSCIDAAMAQVGHCIIECEPRLEKLFRRSFPAASVVGTAQDSDLAWLNGLPTPNWQISSGDLPRLFRPDAASFEPRRAYLQADPRRRAHWRQRFDVELGPGLKVGVSWRGGTAQTRTRARSLPLDAWRPIVEVPGCHFVSLQYGDTRDDRARWQDLYGTPVADFAEMHTDYDETAAAVAALDLVITVCTAVVHLGGALGQRVWVLAPHAPGWRYGAHAPDMPWYRRVAVQRRAADGGWDEICQSMAKNLHLLTEIVSAPAISGIHPSIRGGKPGATA
jgi:Tfp pilus assembly protein PilF